MEIIPLKKEEIPEHKYKIEPIPMEIIPLPKPSPGPEERPVIREQLKVFSALEERPSLLSEEIRKRSIELQRWKKYGYISEREAAAGGIKELPFSMTQMIGNIPDNFEDAVKGISSLIMNTGRLAYRFGKNIYTDLNTIYGSGLKGRELTEKLKEEKFETVEQFKPVSDLAKAVYYDWKSIFVGETPEEISKLPLGKALDAIYEKVERQGLTKSILHFIEDRPLDALLVGHAVKRAIGSGLRVTLETTEKIVPKGTKIADAVEDILSTQRTPITYDLPVIEGGASQVAKTIIFPREYSKDPLIKYIQQKTFDAALEEFPKLKSSLAEKKATNLLNKLRNVYEEANFEERVKMHKEIFEKINTLSKAEQEIIVPYLEGRVSLIQESSEKFKNFEAWYRNLVSEVEGFHIRGGYLTEQTIKERIYQPMMKATGQTLEQVVEGLGDFTPAYIRHFFPKIYDEKMGIHFAETTGKRFRPGFLKKSQGHFGYSEDLKEILPRWSSEYIKFKNTQAFLDDFTSRFGIPANIKDVQHIEGGLKVGNNVYKGYVVIAPDGYLSFYKGKVDFYKEVSKRMKDTTFDEAMGDVLKDALMGTGKEFIGVTKNKPVYLVPKEIASELESFATPFMGSKKAQDAVRILVDKPTQAWKDTVLAITPRWIKNNAVGDAIFDSFEGVGLLSYGRAFRSVYTDLIPDKLMERSFANVMKYNPQLGTTAKTSIGKLIQELEETKVVQGISKVKDLGYAINTMFEQPFVRALYIKLAREKAVEMLKVEGLSKTEVNIFNKMRVIKETPDILDPIIDKIHNTLPVFNLTGNFERKYIKRFVPFYNWYKFMIKYGAKLPENHPFKLVGARGLSALSEEQREQAFAESFPFMKNEIEESGIPSRYDHLWPTGNVDEQGNATFFNARGMNPFVTIQEFADFDVINFMSPVIKVPLERATGEKLFTGQKFKTGEKGDEFKEFKKELPPLWDHVLSQFPQYALLKEIITPAKQWDTGTILNPDPILDKTTGEYKYPIESLDKMLNYAGIDRKTIDIRESWETFIKSRQQARTETFNKYQSSKKTALSFEEIRDLFTELKKDEKKWNAIKDGIKDVLEQKGKEKKELKMKMEEQERTK